MVWTDKAILALVFLSTSSIVLLMPRLLDGYNRRVKRRLRKLPAQSGHPAKKVPLTELTRSALLRIATPLVPIDEDERNRLKRRLIHAGLYSRHAMTIFLGIK